MKDDIEAAHEALTRAAYAYANLLDEDALERHDRMKQARRDGVELEFDPAPSLWRELLALSNRLLYDKQEPARFRAVEPARQLS